MRSRRRRAPSTISGGHSGGDTPLPIPNREVKPASADGTRGASPRESRTPPDFHSKGALSGPFRRSDVNAACPSWERRRGVTLGRRRSPGPSSSSRSAAGGAVGLLPSHAAPASSSGTVAGGRRAPRGAQATGAGQTGPAGPTAPKAPPAIQAQQAAWFGLHRPKRTTGPAPRPAQRARAAHPPTRGADAGRPAAAGV